MPEFWAILQQAQDSLCWLRDILDRAGESRNEITSWDSAVSFVQEEPGKWKRLIRRPRSIALLCELWEAMPQQFQGLFLKACVKAGAYLPPSPCNGGTAGEVCGVCNRLFEDKRAWSHHAVTVHVRVRSSRGIVAGTHCPVCLTQYKSNTGMQYSMPRLVLLSSLELAANPLIMDTISCFLPPECMGLSRHGILPGVDEDYESHSQVISALEDLDCHGHDRVSALQQMLDEYRTVFASVCLQKKTRLRASACQWQAQLEEALTLEFDTVQWASWHANAAEFVIHVDFVQWLGEDAELPKNAISTFRDAKVNIPWLEMDLIELPHVRHADGVSLVIGCSADAPHFVPSAPEKCITADQCQSDPVQIALDSGVFAC